jgi:phage-related protein
MAFTIEFYETVTGRCPVREFLDELKASNPDDFVAVLAGLAKLRSRVYHRPPLSKSIGDDLFELRHVGKLNTRILYFFMKNRQIILVHGIRKKMRALSARDRGIALERRRDWLARSTT